MPSPRASLEDEGPSTDQKASKAEPLAPKGGLRVGWDSVELVPRSYSVPAQVVREFTLPSSLSHLPIPDPEVFERMACIFI